MSRLAINLIVKANIKLEAINSYLTRETDMQNNTDRFLMNKNINWMEVEDSEYLIDLRPVKCIYVSNSS